MAAPATQDLAAEIARKEQEKNEILDKYCRLTCRLMWIKLNVYLENNREPYYWRVEVMIIQRIRNRLSREDIALSLQILQLRAQYQNLQQSIGPN